MAAGGLSSSKTASVMLSLLPQSADAAAAWLSSAGDIFRALLDGIVAAALVPGLCAVVLIMVGAFVNARDIRRRDPVRFTRQQRREGMVRAGGQCEMKVGFRRRCFRPAEHGDHFYLWFKGGSHQPGQLRGRLRQVQPRQG